jgi:hypothetical protein
MRTDPIRLDHLARAVASRGITEADVQRAKGQLPIVESQEDGAVVWTAR